MDELQLKLCDIQGRLFELSGTQEIPSEAFIKAFMTSETAKGLDSSYNKLQWMGDWHYYTGEPSNKILRQAPIETMKRNYLMFHTMAPELAIEDLKEIHAQKK